MLQLFAKHYVNTGKYAQSFDELQTHTEMFAKNIAWSKVNFNENINFTEYVQQVQCIQQTTFIEHTQMVNCLGCICYILAVVKGDGRLSPWMKN